MAVLTGYRRWGRRLLRGDDVVDAEDHARDLRGRVDLLDLHPDRLHDVRLHHVERLTAVDVDTHRLSAFLPVGGAKFDQDIDRVEARILAERPRDDFERARERLDCKLLSPADGRGVALEGERKLNLGGTAARDRLAVLDRRGDDSERIVQDPLDLVDHVLRAAPDEDGDRPGLLAARDERHVVRADLSLFDEVRTAQLLRRQVVEVRHDPRARRLRELLHVALLHPPDRVDAFLGQEVLGDVVDPFLTEDDVRAGRLDLLDHGPQGLLLFIEEHLKLRRIADADLLVHFGLLDLEGAVDERDLRIADELRHPRVDAFLVEDDSIDERRVREVAAVFLLDQDVVNVRADLARDLFDDGLDRVDGDVGQEVRVRPDASTGHRGSRDRSESVLIGPLDGKGELSKEFDGLRRGHPVAVHDERRVDLLLDEALRFLEELPGQDDGARRAVADLVVLGLRDLDQHLGRRVLDLDFLQDRDPVVRDRHVAEGVDEHLVHAFRAEGRLDRVGHRASRGDVVEHRAFPFLALRPFLQDDDLLTAHHENSRRSMIGLLYECCPRLTWVVDRLGRPRRR